MWDRFRKNILARPRTLATGNVRDKAPRIRNILIIILLFNLQMPESNCVQYLKDPELGYSTVVSFLLCVCV